MNSSNPALRESVFKGTNFGSVTTAEGSSVMTIQGVMAKTSILLIAVTIAATFTWQKTLAALETTGSFGAAMPWMIGGLIGGLIVGLVISFKPHLAPSFAVPYALLQGLFLGALSAVYAARFGESTALGGGIVLQAVVLTFATAFSMLGLYAFRIIKVTEKLRSIIFAATGGLMLFYVISMMASLFGVHVPLIHSGGMMGIGFSLFVVALAAFNLLLDFDFIERGARAGAPKYMEWYGAFALMVTLVWLYIELLRLLSKMRSNN